MRRGNDADIICERNVELVGGTMSRYGQLKQQYEELNRSYARLYEETVSYFFLIYTMEPK